jgi:integrase/recombinase XerD
VSTASLANLYMAGKMRRGEWVKRTHEQGRSTLMSFAEAMPELHLITPKRVETWVHSAGHAPAFRASRLSRARGFCQWLVVNGHLKRDPTIEVKRPKIPIALPRALTADEVAAILRACPDNRVRLCVLLMVQEGLRRGEVASIDMADIDWSRHTLSIRGKGGHGQITATLPVSDETWSALLDYLDGARPRHGPLIRNLIHKKRPRLSAARISELVMEAMLEAGVKVRNGDGRSAHALRHTCAHDLLEQTQNVYAVKQALRHASIRSTEIYLRGSVRDLRDTMGGRRYGD